MRANGVGGPGVTAGRLLSAALAVCLAAAAPSRARITTVGGTGQAGYSGDGGPATAARLDNPFGLVRGPDGALYVCDVKNHVIRRLARDGTITTVAGRGQPGYSGDGGPAVRAELNEPYEVRFDLWLALREGNAVYRIDMKARTIHHVAGTGAQGFTGNGGPAKQATLSGPKGLSLGPDGNVYLADTESHSLRKVDLKKGTIELLAGTGEKGDGPEGDPLGCRLSRPHGIFVDADGSIYVGDSEAHRVRVIRRQE